MIVASYDDAFINDFADEFDSYWSKTEGGKNIVSLLSPGGASRRVCLWRSTVDYYLADDDAALDNWFRNRFPGNKKNYRFTTATHIVLERPILPSEYPKSGATVLRFLRDLAPESIELLEEAAETADDKFTISFEGRTDDGPVFFAVEVMPPVKQGMKAERRPDMVQKGFRPGKVPTHIRMQRLFGGNKVERLETMRADASWIHGRDTPTVTPLFGKRVLMIGAGSLGSEVALLLAKTGVGSITLVDPELLDYPNVGRHMLGVTQVRTSKAKSLTQKLAGDFPHMRSIKYFAEDWQSLYGKRFNVFKNTDLIVSTVGSWVAEGRLNQVARSEAGFPPVIYGWAGPFSVAGHAVLIGANGPCFACGMDHFGKALQTVCEWDTETTRKQPHCGASIQPYGPVSLSGVAALVAKAATKALLGEVPPGTETVYWASKEEVAEQGGRFSSDFLNYFTDVPDFGGTSKFEWRQKEDCVFCGGS
ncbi:ThiF family adenylyltransferase [Pontivivens nitratireducens]|uniref:ThiF family adenylyltransferase n=1 Tax=Pontivivens nitratireducens TaxID=2758038 RepID=A0A6G7VKE2_9RHOB|nr:ThiF family adenylyltransferase [Pontibrevibacter nitratireducens]QIK40509.1 ThiF family adenylyltransferase [Pontibrevibacter nitratireducens]